DHAHASRDVRRRAICIRRSPDRHLDVDHPALRRVRGIWLTSVGLTLNLIVIVANGERMPVAPELAASLVRHGTLGQYTVMRPKPPPNLWGAGLAQSPLPDAYRRGDGLLPLGLDTVVSSPARTPRAKGEKGPPPP